MTERSINSRFLMARRSYKMARRGESADETRRRIVEATFALHMEQGIAATSMKQIAARADVSVGAVYHHFPTYDDAIGGCAAHVRATFPLPTAEGFEARRGLADRVAGYVETLFAAYAAFPGAEAARMESSVSRHVAAWFEEEAANRLALAERVLAGVAVPASAAAALAALSDISVYGSLVRSGLSPEEAAATLTSMLTAWLAVQTRSTSHEGKEAP
jgi:AcrR family transcriptional regulator